jgi:hypothetical protein
MLYDFLREKNLSTNTMSVKNFYQVPTLPFKLNAIFLVTKRGCNVHDNAKTRTGMPTGFIAELWVYAPADNS